MSRLLGREPAATVGTVVLLLTALLPAFGWSGERVGVVSAALVVIGGAVTAALVEVDRLFPLLVGVAKAVLAVMAAFGLHLSDNYVAAIVGVLTVVSGFVVTRSQVKAKQPPVDRQGREVDLNGWPIGQLDVDETDVEPVTSTLPRVQEPPRQDRHDYRTREQQPRHGTAYGRHSGRLDPA